MSARVSVPLDVDVDVTAGGLHVAWARLFVRALVASGVRYVVVSPGSRSTPIVVAVAEAEAAGDIGCDVVVDERSAAFVALGYARATGAPAALVCTSGTAAMHYGPAVIEASLGHVPLVVVTADRPWEAYDASAAQTIDQTKLFGAHVRHFADVGTPEGDPGALAGVARVAAQAVARATSPTSPGPVHVNVRFRKPLEPVAAEARRAGAVDAWKLHANEIAARGAPRVIAAAAAPDGAAARALAAACGARRGVIVCGPARADGDVDARRAAVLAFARATGYPVIAEATSQVRFGPGDPAVLRCTSTDALLRALARGGDDAPERIVQVGAPPTASAYAALVAARPRAVRWVLGGAAWADPSGDADVVVVGDPWALLGAACAHVGAARAHVGGGRSGDGAWAERVASLDLRARETAENAADRARPLSEVAIARAVVAALPAGAWLVVGNSRPVRDLDAAAVGGQALRVVHQRGAAGIDGLVSVAAGVRRGTRAPVALVVGDVAMLHDVGGLAAARDVGGPLAVVVVDNGGGRIFGSLPVAGAIDRATFDRFFLTPPRVDFELAARAFGLRAVRVDAPEALRGALSEALAADAARVIVCAVTPERAPGGAS